jgi:hypothetical protein
MAWFRNAGPSELPDGVGTARLHGTAEVPMRTTAPMLAALLALVSAAGARADVVEATSTTLVTAGQQLRGALATETPKLDTVVPLYEILSVRASELRNPLRIENLEVVFSGWASYDLGEVRWSSGTTDKFTGDITTGYVRGSVWDRRITLRLGREYVVAGAGRMLQLDGGDLLLRLPAGFSLSAFAGLPVAQRFRTRHGDQTWNPAGGDQTWGGRLGWTLPLPGAPGMGLAVGLSVVAVTDHGYDARKDAAVDARLQAWKNLVLTAGSTYSLAAGRFAETNVNALWTASPKLFVNLGAKRTAPDLFLSQNSILSVFADANRTDVGGGFRYQVSRSTSLGLDYQALIEPTGEGSKTTLGHQAAARAEWERATSRLGGELSFLQAPGLGSKENGYVGVRVFGRHDYRRIYVAADVAAYFLKEEVNGNKTSLNGSLSAGYPMGRGWSAVVAGHAGVTPFLTQQADLLVKLVYNQTYRVREVK